MALLNKESSELIHREPKIWMLLGILEENLVKLGGKYGIRHHMGARDLKSLHTQSAESDYFNKHGSADDITTYAADDITT